MPEGMLGAGCVRWVSGLVLMCSLVVAGCASAPPSTREPLDLQVLLSPNGGGQRAVVFLPGSEDRPSDFVEKGPVESLRKTYPDVDVYIPDAHRGYYARGELVERLNTDVLAPLRNRGYEGIYVVGVSMGGYGALLHVYQHPENVDGIVLISPYLGEDGLIEEIRDSGGVRGWHGPAPAAGEPIDSEAELWGWFADWPDGQPDVPIFMAYGRDESFAEANGMLASLLSRDAVIVADGEHDWPTWQYLWQQFLARGSLLTDP